MNEKKNKILELKGVPYGRLLQVGGYVALALSVVHAGRLIVATVVRGIVDGINIESVTTSVLSGVVQASPYLFLISGFLAVGRLGKLYEEGIIFAAETSRQIKLFGEALGLTALAMMIIRPTVLDWIAMTSWGIRVRIDEGVLLSLVAAIFVSAMANAMERATRVEEENRQFI